MLDCADQFEFPLNIKDLNLPPTPWTKKNHQKRTKTIPLQSLT